MNKNKRLCGTVCAALTASMLLTGISLPAAAEHFTDVNSADWFCDAVEYMADLEVINGTDTGIFEPYTNVTRSMFAAMLWRYEGCPTVNYAMPFKDIAPDAYYAEAVRWAAAEGIITGYDGETFSPDDVIKREQAAAMLYRFAETDGCDMSIGENTNILSYDDIFSVSEYAVSAFEWTVGLGVMSGRTDTTLNPLDTLTRAEAARILYLYRTACMNSLSDREASNDPEKAQISGSVISIDHHGHVTTDIEIRDFAMSGFMPGDIITISVNGKMVNAPYVTDYTDVDDDFPAILSRVDNEHISAAINMGDFASEYNVEAGSTITFTMAEKGGYEQELVLRSSAIYTYDRHDYPSDEAFANFRAVTAGGISPDVLYRSSSPINPVIGRNEYADKLCEAAGIRTVIDLTDAGETAAQALDGYNGSYYSTLNVYYCRIGLQLNSEQFKTELAHTFRAISEAETPILIHCQQGRDQTGLVMALIEALCGADYEEIIDDYMLSFENFYNIEYKSEQWQHIANGNIVPGLCRFAGVQTAEELENADLQGAARAYLTNIIGLTDAELDAVYSALHK
ncbi:MAG: S-layer homology domain-containing protein [Candidatus Ornithomonoglobus sp.]